MGNIPRFWGRDRIEVWGLVVGLRLHGSGLILTACFADRFVYRPCTPGVGWGGGAEVALTV